MSIIVEQLVLGIRKEVKLAMSEARPGTPPTDAEIDAHTFIAISISLAKAMKFIIEHHGLAVAVEVTNPGTPIG